MEVKDEYVYVSQPVLPVGGRFNGPKIFLPFSRNT